ncbi:MAG: autotransporter-associated beta strand repeat-containing protein [bacterium]
MSCIPPRTWVRLALSMTCLLAAVPARAATNVWSGAGGDNTWTNTSNWYGPYTPGDFSQFTNVTTTINFSVSTNTSGILLSDATGNVTLTNTANTLILSGGDGLNIQTGALTLTLGAITLGAVHPWIIASGATLTVNCNVTMATFPLAIVNDDNAAVYGTISGSGGLAKSGLGTFILGGSNIYTGGTFVTTGILRASGANALPTGGDVTLTGGVLDIATNQSIGQLFGTAGVISNSSNSAQTLTLGSGVSAASNAVFQGSINVSSGTNLTVTKIGLGTQTLFQVAGSAANSPVINLYGGTLILTGALDNTSAAGGTITNGTMILAKTAASMRAFNGGIVTVGANGIVMIGGNGGDQLSQTVNMTLANSGRFDLNGYNESFNQLTGPGIITNSAASTPVTLGVGQNGSSFILGGQFKDSSSNAISLQKLGAGVITMTNRVGHGGLTIISAGKIVIAHSLAVQNSTVSNLVAGGIVFSNTITSAIFGGLAGSTAFGLTNTAGTALALTVGTNNVTTAYSGIMGGSGSLTKTGTGQLTLNGANTYTGATIIGVGTLALGVTGALATGSSVSIAAGATFDVSGLGASATYTLGGSASLTANGTGTIVGTSAAAIKGGSSGTISLGSRPVTLTFDGSHPALYISQGTLSLNGNAFTVNSASPLTVGSYTIIQQASGTVTSNGTFTVSGTAIGPGTIGSILISGGAVNLVIAVIPPYLTITSVNGGANPTAGTGFNVSLQVRFGIGTPTNVSANTPVTLSLATGTGNLGGTLAGTILTGSNSMTISGVTYTKAESGVILTATRTGGDSLTAGISAPFTVNPGAAVTMALTSGNTQSGLRWTALTNPFVITVTDANGNPVSGVGVTFAIATVPGGATNQLLSTTNSTTVSTGQASSTLTLGNTIGTYTVTASSSGLNGSPMTFTANAITGNYAVATQASYEYQVCYKCHAGYAWLPDTPPNGISVNGTDLTPILTDVAQEFSPNNKSGHPIVTGLTNYPNSVAPKALLAAAMKAPWTNNVGTQTMMCSDCHNTDSATPAAQGPHGSASQFMLRGPNVIWPNTTSFAASFCANCHSDNVSMDGHGGHHGAVGCYACHIVIPHGGKVSRLIGDRNTMPARYAWNSTLTTMQITAFTKTTANNYSEGNCAGCGEHNGGTEHW